MEGAHLSADQATRATRVRLQSVAYPQGVVPSAYSPTTGQLIETSAPSGETTSFTYDGFLNTSMAWSGRVSGAVAFGFEVAGSSPAGRAK
jgi:hypothetical protein